MKLLWALASVLPALADPIQFTDSDSGLASSIALVQNGSATDIQMQMTAPSTAGWGAIGVGAEMAGSLFFVMYPSASGQAVTVSVRSAPGHVMPTAITGIQYQVTNSSIDPNAKTMMAQFTCYGCTKWSSGSLDTNSSQQPFIYALGPGDTIQSDDVNAQIERHNSKGMFMGNAASALTQSSSGPSTAVPPIAPGSSNTKTQEEKEPNKNMVLAHAALLCLAFYFFMPAAVFVLRLPFIKSFSFQGHWMIQSLSWVLAVVGLIIALVFSKQSSFSKIDKYHQIIGIVVICLVIIQPLGGLIHHMQFKKTHSRGVMSYGHIVFGWIIVFLGMLNATFGLHLTENDKAAGGLGAAGIVILLAMLGASVWGASSKKTSQSGRPDKREMQTVDSN